MFIIIMEEQGADPVWNDSKTPAAPLWERIAAKVKREAYSQNFEDGLCCADASRSCETCGNKPLEGTAEARGHLDQGHKIWHFHTEKSSFLGGGQGASSSSWMPDTKEMMDQAREARLERKAYGLPGQRRDPEGAMCDEHEDRGALYRVQGETDSFGSEHHNMCKECYEAYKTNSEADKPGTCDWCHKEVPDRRPKRDTDGEGSSGPVYYVCTPCAQKYDKSLHDEYAAEEAEAEECSCGHQKHGDWACHYGCPKENCWQD